MSGLPGSVVAHMERAHGVTSRQQLLQVPDVTPRRLQRWMASGHLVAPAFGVVSVPGVPLHGDGALRVAVARSGRDARLGPRTSLAVRALGGFAVDEGRGRIDVTIPPSRRVRRSGYEVRRLVLDRSDRALVRGLPVLSAARSIVAVAAELDESRLVGLIDDAVRMGVTSRALLDARAVALSSQPGAARVRGLIGAGTLRMESEMERRTFADLRRIDPPPELQVEDLVPGRRLDFAWRAYRYALEADGRRWHGALVDRTADNLRDLEAGIQAVIVHRLTWAMVTTGRERTLDLVLRNLARRAAELGLPAPRLGP